MSQSRQAAPSPWSFRIATVAGIPIRLHFTFLLFMAWIAVIGQGSEDSTWAALIPAIFLCVVVHELGHALVAQRFGIRTRDITLYPIGGVAMLQGRAKPAHELWIALAGPAVNVAIALAILPLLLAFEGSLPPPSATIQGKSFLQGLFTANVALALFNMIPAFPMDGGRVLRAVLALNMPEARATRIAGGIGQLLAIGFGFAGLIMGNILLMVIAFFVFIGAGEEVAASVGFSLVSGRRVADAMMTQFRVIGNGQSLSAASKMLLEGAQNDFPVVWGNEVLGLLTRDDIVRGLATEGPDAYVAGHMRREFKRMAPHEPLEKALETFAQRDHSPVLVMDGDSLLGMLTVENLGEFMMLEQARKA